MTGKGVVFKGRKKGEGGRDGAKYPSRKDAKKGENKRSDW